MKELIFIQILESAILALECSGDDSDANSKAWHILDDAIKNIKEKTNLAEKEQLKDCQWFHYNLGTSSGLETECGHVIRFELDSGFSYCPYCGGRLKHIKLKYGLSVGAHFNKSNTL